MTCFRSCQTGRSQTGKQLITDWQTANYPELTDHFLIMSLFKHIPPWYFYHFENLTCTSPPPPPCAHLPVLTTTTTFNRRKTMMCLRIINLHKEGAGMTESRVVCERKEVIITIPITIVSLLSLYGPSRSDELNLIFFFIRSQWMRHFSIWMNNCKLPPRGRSCICSVWWWAGSSCSLIHTWRGARNNAAVRGREHTQKTSGCHEARPVCSPSDAHFEKLLVC